VLGAGSGKNKNCGLKFVVTGLIGCLRHLCVVSEEPMVVLHLFFEKKDQAKKKKYCASGYLES
jgi:hypothetical protein